MLYYPKEVYTLVDNINFTIDLRFRTIFKSLRVSYSDLPLHTVLQIQLENCIVNSQEIQNLTREGIIELQNNLWNKIANLSQREQLLAYASQEHEVKPVFDYVYDYPYVYASFLNEYGIDLERNEDLTWFEFKALFESLSDKSMIKQVIHIRTMKLPKLSKDAE